VTQIAPATASEVKERILLEVRPTMIPAIVNFETLVLIGIVVLIALFTVVFRIGPMEIAIISAAYLLLAFPNFRQIFMAGSTTYVLTNRRLVVFQAGIKQKEQAIPLSEIDSAKCRPSGLQAFYGAGDIILYRRGLRRPVRLLALPQCRSVAEQINKAVANFQK
jgi:hypothetical protein